MSYAAPVQSYAYAAPQIEYVAPAPVSYAYAAPQVEYVAPAPVSYAAPQMVTQYMEVPAGPPVWVPDYTAPAAVLPSQQSMITYPTTGPAPPAKPPTPGPAAPAKKASKKKAASKKAKKGCC
jgi:hypothetical protein